MKRLSVGVCAFNFETDKTEQVGEITYDGTEVRFSSLEHPFVRGIYDNPVFESDEINRRLREVHWATEPELFMQLLAVEYHGSYAFCERPTENGKLKSVGTKIENS
jgi:hypothetical protein